MMKSQEHVDVAAITTRLAELCPKAIFVYEQRRQPLAIGIRAQISERVGDATTPDELNAALRAYTRNVGYLRAMARGGVRIDLEGEPAGMITAEQVASAARGVAAHWARKAARKAAARMACSSSETPAPSSTGPLHSSPTPMSEQPRKISLADLRASAQARRAAS
jgi:ProP effector